MNWSEWSRGVRAVRGWLQKSDHRKMRTETSAVAMKLSRESHMTMSPRRGWLVLFLCISSAHHIGSAQTIAAWLNNWYDRIAY